MAEDCPVCGEPFEYREVEEPSDGEGGAGVTVEVDELCEVDPGTRWNRICPRATLSEGNGTPRARLELFRHHWDSGE